MQSPFTKLELINDIPVELLDDPVQRELYKQKLRQEVAHFKQREALYVAKRRELQQLELRFRQNNETKLQSSFCKTTSLQGSSLIVTTLMGQIKDAKYNLDLQKTATRDLAEKMREITETIRQRQRDFDEIQRQAEGKQDRGRTAQSDLENQQA